MLHIPGTNQITSQRKKKLTNYEKRKKKGNSLSLFEIDNNQMNINTSQKE